jgi:hypothetical protein
MFRMMFTADAEFCAGAYKAVPALLAEVRRLWGEGERLRKALEAVVKMAMTPERDAYDQYDAWHGRLKEAARAALAPPASPPAEEAKGLDHSPNLGPTIPYLTPEEAARFLRNQVARYFKHRNQASVDGMKVALDEYDRLASLPASPAPTKPADAPKCTLCGATAVWQDIDGNWWPPCSHAKALGPDTLRYAAPATPPADRDAIADPEDAAVKAMSMLGWLKRKYATGPCGQECGTTQQRADTLKYLGDLRAIVNEFAAAIRALNDGSHNAEARGEGGDGAGWIDGADEVPPDGEQVELWEEIETVGTGTRCNGEWGWSKTMAERRMMWRRKSAPATPAGKEKAHEL